MPSGHALATGYINPYFDTMTRQEKLNAMACVLPEDVMETVDALCELHNAGCCVGDIFAWDGEDMERQIVEEHFTNLASMVLFMLKDRLMRYINDSE